MTEQPNTAAGQALMDAFVSDAEAALDRGGQVLDWDGMRRRVLAIEAEARQQDGSALRVLLDAIETMDQKITPYGEREDGTILHYIVADSTWHRILAAARSAEIYAALPPSAPPAKSCGVTIYGLDCVLPSGHNVGRADIPENHQAAPPSAPPALDEPEPTHPWDGMPDGHNCATCGPESIWKCDRPAHPSRPAGRVLPTRAEYAAEAERIVDGLVAPPSAPPVLERLHTVTDSSGACTLPCPACQDIMRARLQEQER